MPTSIAGSPTSLVVQRSRLTHAFEEFVIYVSNSFLLWKILETGAMPTLAVGMWRFPRVLHMPTASVGMAPNFSQQKLIRILCILPA